MSTKKIAYLVSVYPAPSHTFIRREILALQKEGLKIVPISINKPQNNWKMGDADLKEQERTVYLKPINSLSFIIMHLKSIFTRPGRYFRTLSFAMKHRAPGVKNLIWSIFYFAEAVLLADHIKNNGIEHVHNHFANSGANVGLFASKLSHVPWSLTLHGLADWTYPSGNTLPEKLIHADFIACVSYYGRAQAFRVSSPEIWNKIFVSRCGIDMEQFIERKQINNVKTGVLKIITIGRLSPEKGHSGLIDSFFHAVNKGLDAELIIGGGGPNYKNLENQIKKLNLHSRCFLKGQLTEEEVINEFSKADIFVLSSFMEGLPVVLMEAMSMKIPVIAPCVAGIPELVKPGETGLLFIPGDWGDLTEKILEISNNPALVQKITEGGYKLIRNEFAIEKAILPKLMQFKD